MIRLFRVLLGCEAYGGTPEQESDTARLLLIVCVVAATIWRVS